MNIQYDGAARRCNFIWCAHNMMKEYAGIDIPAAKLDKIIGDKMDSEWQEYDYDPNDYSMDTSPREEVFDIIAEYYLGHPWPMYMDNADMTDYMIRLCAAIEGDK